VRGSTPWLFPSRTLLIIPHGPLQVFMALIRIGIEGFYGMNWLACSVGETCLGVLGRILMSLAFTVKDRVRLVYVLP
jgi:hypothetical protein